MSCQDRKKPQRIPHRCVSALYNTFLQVFSNLIIQKERDMDEEQKQRQYYQKTASVYDSMQAFDKLGEHFVATAMLRGLLELYQVQSLLDVGCGTGRTLSYLQEVAPELQLFGVEPVQSMVDECLNKGFSSENVRIGNACQLNYPDSSVDCVSMFGVLHHVRDPRKAIEEAVRVAAKMIFISDHNIYGMGGAVSRTVKQAFRFLGQRRLLAFAMTRGKGFHDTDWDGVFYPFSLVDHFEYLKGVSSTTYSMSTKTPAINLLRDASHIAIAAIK